MVLLFTCGIKAHTPVMYTGSEQSWNGEGRAREWSIGGGGAFKMFNAMHASTFGSAWENQNVPAKQNIR